MAHSAQSFPGKAIFAIAALTVAVIGAIGGASIGASPILRADAAEAYAASSGSLGSSERWQSGERPPDHYPLVTPQGTIPVAELALHGRLRDRTGAWWTDQDEVLLDASYENAYSDEEIDALAMADATAPSLTAVTHEPEPGEPGAKVPHTAARILDIDEALAAQDDL